jgi:transcriptional regulator with XRE-family HTH domain
MANTYPIRFPAQLRQHLRALRKKHGLTQANVAALIGVSQARIAEIEANPGLVSFEQVMQLLAALGATVTLCDTVPSSLSDEANDSSQSETSITRQGRTVGVHETLEPDGGSDKGRRALEGSSDSDGVRKVLEDHGGPTQANTAKKASSRSDIRRRALDSLGTLDQACRDLEANSGSDAVRKAIDSLGGLDQARRALEASSGVDAARKALDSLGGLEQARKVLGALDSLHSYRNALVHSKKGNW